MPHALSERDLRRILVALAIYLTSLLAANTLGLKIMPFVFGSHISVGVLSFPVVFLMTDVIGEVYGKRMSKLFVLAGFVSTALFLAYSLLSLWLPWAREGLWAQAGYDQIFGVSTRIALASLAAFAIAEYQDVLSFFFLKARFGERLFWLRALLSSLWSQLLDSIIFMLIAFLGVYDTHTLLVLIVTWWLFKVAMGFIYTPLCYLGIHILKQGSD
ncbi:MAG: queuosine precursor transporter [Patescibacteria group bacterium]